MYTVRQYGKKKNKKKKQYGMYPMTMLYLEISRVGRAPAWWGPPRRCSPRPAWRWADPGQRTSAACRRSDRRDPPGRICSFNRNVKGTLLEISVKALSGQITEGLKHWKRIRQKEMQRLSLPFGGRTFSGKNIFGRTSILRRKWFAVWCEPDDHQLFPKLLFRQ